MASQRLPNRQTAKPRRDAEPEKGMGRPTTGTIVPGVIGSPESDRPGQTRRSVLTARVYANTGLALRRVDLIDAVERFVQAGAALARRLQARTGQECLRISFWKPVASTRESGSYREHNGNHDPLLHRMNKILGFGWKSIHDAGAEDYP
jgi:hypothetical protein